MPDRLECLLPDLGGGILIPLTVEHLWRHRALVIFAVTLSVCRFLRWRGGGLQDSRDTSAPIVIYRLRHFHWRRADVFSVTRFDQQLFVRLPFPLLAVGSYGR